MLPLNDLFVMALMTIIIIVGVYQFYFLTQNHMLKSARRFSTTFDDKIPFQPSWVWIYSGLYYPMIVAIILTMDDMRHYNLTVISFIFLMMMQMICFRYYPVETPPEWREFGNRTGFNIAFIRLIQKYDGNTNCFPSMHTSVATLTALHMMGNEPWLGSWPLVFPLLIAISTLFTKQHYFVDLVPGAVLGWIVWKIHLWFIG